MAVFILNDETKVNSHGFYLLNAGGRFDRFNENPVMLYNHNAEEAVGKWLNLRVEGECLEAECDFDMADERAARIAGKVERGYLRGASPGICVLKAERRRDGVTNRDELYVTEWEMMEASVVSIPSNAGALSLKVYDRECRPVDETSLKCHLENIVRLSMDVDYSEKPINKENMEINLSAEACVALGVKQNADSAALSAAIVKLKADNDRMNAEMDAEREKTATDLVELAIREGRITAEKRQSFMKLALSDFGMAKETLGAIPCKTSLSANLRPIAGNGSIAPGRETWTLLKWMKEDKAGLEEIRKGDGPAYEEIVKRK